MNRTRPLRTAALTATLTLASFVVAQETPSNPPAGTALDSHKQSADAAIRKAAETFIVAFDRGDAKTLAKHFTSDAVYINENGQRFAGREAIQKEYETLFANSSNLRLRLEIDSIELVGASTAVETGRLALTPQPAGANRVMSQYTAIHTNQGGEWMMAHVRDNRVELPPDHGQLQDLDWMVGTWTASNKDTHIEVKSRWIQNRNFLARSHAVTESGKVTSTGLQIVGIDPMTGQVTSWSFASDGGLAVGFWGPQDNGWIVRSIGWTADGTETNSTEELTRKDKDSLAWSSVDRFAGETPLPDTQQVTLKRKTNDK